MDSSGPELGDLLSMGLTLALCVIIGFGLGWLGDLATGTFPLIAMIGLALGVVLATRLRREAVQAILVKGRCIA